MSEYSFSSLMQQRMFLRFWITRLAGTAASQMLMVAVGWQMYELTGSAWDLGLVGLYQFLPALLLMLVAGYVADRVKRTHIVAACLAMQLLVAALLCAASFEHATLVAVGNASATRWLSRELLLAVSVLLGTTRAFQMPAQQALIALLVPAALLPRAMAFSASGMQAAIIVGPAIGGVIYAAGAAAVYGASATLFALGCGLMMFVRYRHAPTPYERPTVKTLLAEIGRAHV